MYDVIIIGGGPIGLAAGIEAGRHGLSYCIIEKGVLVNSLYHYPDKMTFFSTSEKLEIGGVPFVSHNPKPTRQEALEYYRRVSMKFELDIRFYEELLSLKKKAETFLVKTAKGNYQAHHVIFATGFYDKPNRLGVPGEHLPKVRHYYHDAHPYFRQKIVVVGARNSAVDVALECWRKGAEVTMIIRDSEVSPRVKYWVRPDMVNRIEEGSIPAYFNSEITEITETELTFKNKDGEKTIANDFVLAMTGYQPDFSMLEKTGVKLKKEDEMKPHFNPETMESNVPGLYLAGVVVGGLETAKWFIENSRVHAELIIKAIAEKTGAKV